MQSMVVLHAYSSCINQIVTVTDQMMLEVIKDSTLHATGYFCAVNIDIYLLANLIYCVTKPWQ